MKAFRNSIVRLGLNKRDKFVLGVSGGIDSIVMLDLFHRENFKNVIVANLNHGLRPEAEKEQLFVEKLASKLGYAFEGKTLKQTITGNLENQLRELRREYLLSVVKKHNADYLILAHNKNDQAETFLLNLLRGSGPAGLSAMSGKEGKIIRPLLDISRDEIAGYAKKYKLNWFEDVTNQDITYKRNYIRHKVFPFFSDINPEYLENIARTAKVQQEIDLILKKAVRRNLKSDISELRKLEKPVLFEYFALNYEKLKGDRKELSLKHFEAFLALIADCSGTKSIDLPGKVKIKRTYDKLEFLVKKTDNTNSVNAPMKLNMGSNSYGSWELIAEYTEEDLKNTEVGVAFLDKGIFEGLKVRNWQFGDKILKEGIKGSKKLQDLFTDAKINIDERKNWPILIDKNGEIIWIPLLAFSRKAKPKTNKQIRITARKE